MTSAGGRGGGLGRGRIPIGEGGRGKEEGRGDKQPARNPANGFFSVVNKVAAIHDFDRFRKLVSSQYEYHGLNFNQDVRPYKDVPAKRLMTYRVRRVISPFEFYLEFANFPASHQYSAWFHDMQTFYRDSRNRDKLKVIKEIPIPGRCYVCRDPEDGKWHRVRVHHATGKQIKILTVFYLDLCKQKEATIDNLVELAPQFSDAPAQVFRCYLHDILPVPVATAGVKDQKNSRITWSREACKYFRDLVKDKEFSGIVLTRSNTLITDGLPDFFANLGVVLVENVPGTSETRVDVCTVNAQMVDAGFAVATGVCAGCPHVFQMEGYKPAFDQSHFEWQFPIPSSSSQAMALEKRQKETQGPYNEQNGNEASSIVGSLDEQLSNIMRENLRLNEHKYASSYKNTTENLPAIIACRMAPVKLIFLVSPSCIFVHLKSQIEQLNAMQEGLRQAVEMNWGPDQLDRMTNGAPGMFVACHILNNETTEESMWVRGIIMNANKKENTYKVLIVDYGNEISVDNIFVRPLPSYFEQIPAFVIRLHLDVENVVPGGCSGGWTSGATVEFRKYAFGWEKYSPWYFMYRPPQSEALELDHFGQQIMYHFDQKKWLPVRGRIPPSYQVINEMKDHPMVHNLMVSFGAELNYEIIMMASHYWHFKTILDSLIEQGHADEWKEKRNSAKLHVEISQAASSNRVERRVSSLSGVASGKG